MATGEVVKGDGYSVAPSLGALGEGYGFRKVRRALDVTAFGVNVIAIPPGFESGQHFHEEQEELYFVHRGTLVMKFGDGSSHELSEGGVARVDASTVRSTANPSESDDTGLPRRRREGRLRRTRRQGPRGRDEPPRRTGLADQDLALIQGIIERSLPPTFSIGWSAASLRMRSKFSPPA